MKILESAGAASQRVGDGSYLSAGGGNLLDLPLSLPMLADGVSLAEVFEAHIAFHEGRLQSYGGIVSVADVRCRPWRLGRR